MQTFLTLPYEKENPLPPPFEDDVRTPAAYVSYFVEQYTNPGDVVLDVFAGFGTTLRVAEELGRTPYGIEYDATRVEYARDRIDHGDNLFHGSALDLGSVDLPPVDLCLTSPPYMVEGMERDPLQNYDGETTYPAYLDRMGSVFADLEAYVAPDSHVLVDVSNMKHEGEVTTLAWDLAGAARETFDFAGEVVVGWENEDDGDGTYGYGYDHSYCMVFTTPP